VRPCSAAKANSALVFGCDFRDAMRRRSCCRWSEVFGPVGVGSAKDMFM
jgi:hypothetical protein